MSEGTYRCLEIALLLLNAAGLWWYVVLTRNIAKSAIQQAFTAAQQAEISAQQLEALARPVLVMRDMETDLQLVNIGTGPALDVKWWYWPEEHVGPGSLDAPSARMSFLEPRQAHSINQHPNFLRNPARKLFCIYKSVSGTTYITNAFQRRDTMVGKWYEHSFARDRD